RSGRRLRHQPACRSRRAGLPAGNIGIAAKQCSAAAFEQQRCPCQRRSAARVPRLRCRTAVGADAGCKVTPGKNRGVALFASHGRASTDCARTACPASAKDSGATDPSRFLWTHQRLLRCAVSLAKIGVPALPRGIYFDLSRKSMSVAQTPPPAAPGSAVPEPTFLPTLMGEGDGTYRARPSIFVFSYLLDLVIVGVVVWSGNWVVQHRQEIKKQVVALVTDVSPYTLPASKTQAGGGGGGGDRDKFAASKGAAPKFAAEQITPPAIVVRNPDPKLVADPTVVGPPSLQLPQTGQMGDPFSTILGPASNGTGSGGGIGSGCGGGVGSGRGPGVGPGWGGGIGGGAYKVGGGVSAPR